MRLREHILKANRLEATLRRLDEAEDFEMVIDLCMLAATHLLNAAMHAEGVTHAHSDQGHTSTPPLDSYSKKPSGKILHGVEALAYIENLRPIYVYGDQGYDSSVAKACFSRYEEAKDCFMEVIGELSTQPGWAGEATDERKTSI